MEEWQCMATSNLEMQSYNPQINAVFLWSGVAFIEGGIYW